MYENYWGLTESPFQNTGGERWFYQSRAHEEALARLYYLIEHERRCGLLVGPAGTGKSLLLHVLAKQLRRTQRQVAVVDLLGLDRDEFLWELAVSLNVVPGASSTVYELWRSVRDHLQGLQLSRLQTVMLFDHADRITADCVPIFERLLHVGDPTRCQTTMIVASETPRVPGSSNRLAEMSDLRIELTALGALETAELVQQSLQKAGCNANVFDASALKTVFELTGGIPEDINRLCDLSLLAGMGERCSTIDAEIVNAAGEELQPHNAAFSDRSNTREFVRNSAS